MDARSGDKFLDLALNAANRAAADLSPRHPWLWAIQMRSDAGWFTEVLPGVFASLVVAEKSAQLPYEVRVMAIDRVGNASPPAILALR